MKKTNQLSLRDTLYLGVMAAIGGIAVTAIGLGAWLWRAPETDERLQQAEHLAEILALDGAAVLAHGQHDRIDQWLAQVVGTAPVVAMAVYDATDDIVAMHAEHADYSSILARLEYPTRPFVAMVELQTSDTHAPVPSHVWRAQWPIRPSPTDETTGHAAALILPVDAAQSQVSFAIFAIPLTVAAIAIALLAAHWLTHRLIEPLEQLVVVSGNPHVNHAANPIGYRRDTVGRLARQVDRLLDQITEWQSRAEQLEHTIDTRVSFRTRQIRLALTRAERQVWIDALTGVTSRRFIDEQLPAIFDAQRDANQDLSLVMIDVNDFKTFNDTFGHPSGDELLRFTGTLLKHCIRDTDIAARYGGDEFMLILPAVSAEDAAVVATRAVALFGQQAKILPCPGTRIGISAGVASLHRNAPDTITRLIATVDDALYCAKRADNHIAIARKQPATASSVST